MQENVSAIATPHGKGGVAIIRISGETALELASKMFRPNAKIPVVDFQPYRMYTGEIKAEGFTDYGMCVYFKAPHSYTGEDVVEFHCHGGESIARGVLKRTYALGARPATRGEFTKRAFLNGKLSLASAEGVADMINGESEAEVKAGYMLYSEKLTERVKALQSALTTALAEIDVSFDYPEEDLEEVQTAQTQAVLEETEKEILSLLSGYATGRKIKSGVTVALCGKPNTGKSSLLNRLLGYDKAIVSSIAGTTRDAVEGTIEIEGRKFNLYDTAGVRESGDEIESIGIQMAERIIQSADVAVYVVDATDEDSEDLDLLSRLEGKPLIKIVNKIDLASGTNQSADLEISAMTGEGIERLKTLLYEKSFGDRGEDAAFLIEERHYDALRRAKDSVTKALNACRSESLDLIAVDVKECWDALGEITGETATERIIEEIFSKFCVGK